MAILEKKYDIVYFSIRDLEQIQSRNICKLSPCWHYIKTLLTVLMLNSLMPNDRKQLNKSCISLAVPWTDAIQEVSPISSSRHTETPAVFHSSVSLCSISIRLLRQDIQTVLSFYSPHIIYSANSINKWTLKPELKHDNKACFFKATLCRWRESLATTWLYQVSTTTIMEPKKKRKNTLSHHGLFLVCMDQKVGKKPAEV